MEGIALARTVQEIETEFARLKTLLNSLPEGKKEMADEIKGNMRKLKQERQAAQEAANRPRKKKEVRASSSIFANVIALMLLLFLGVFALTYFGGKLLAL